MPALDVSVALCTCNGARWIDEQVRSIAQQTMPVRELVVRDDASSDDTVDRVRQAWASAGRPADNLHITVNPHRLGVARNFEAALRDCTGEFIALCDQDDRWDPRRVAHLVGLLQQSPGALLVHGDAQMIGADGALLGSTLLEELQAGEEELEAVTQGEAWKVFLQRNLVTGATVMLRRALLATALPVPPHWLHDEWLGMVAALLGGLVLEREGLTHYRRHDHNQIGAVKPTLATLVRRALTQRDDWPLRQHRRALELRDWARERAGLVSPEQLSAVEAKAFHHAVRAQLPAARPRRVGPIWREWRAGRYQLYGRGLHGVLRDLLQPG